MVAATKVKGGGALMKYDAAFAALAEQIGKQEAAVGTSNFISVKNADMSYRGNAIPGNKLEVIVFDALIEQQLFLTPYDPDTPATPDCYAFSEDRTEKSLVPHADAPNKQSANCEECPHFQWGTSDRGRGKKCSSVRRLGLILASEADTPASIEKAEIAFIKVPTTSVKGWAGYANSIANTLKKPPFGVVTEIAVVKDDKTQLKLQFRMVEAVSDPKVFPALFAKYDEVQKVLATPYVAMEAEAKPAPKKNGAKKVVAPKKKF